MQYEYCNAYGFTQERIEERLRLFELKKEDHELAEQLQEMVIEPNLRNIVNHFYDYLGHHKEYSLFLPPREHIDKLKKTQLIYLSTLGVDFYLPSYFDMRLRVGVAHSRIGMPLGLYECAYQKMRSLILACIPNEFDDEVVRSLREFTSKVISFDMSLAIDSYLLENVNTLEKSIGVLKQESKKYKLRSEIDPLPHVLNRAALLAYATNCIADANKHKKPLTVIMADFDNLGEVNDKYGHLAGDFVLKAAVEKIRSLLPKQDQIGRYGGDEFLIVMSGIEDPVAKQLVKEIEVQIEQSEFPLGKLNLQVKLSFGCATLHEPSSLSEVLREADKSLIKHKRERIGHG